uniref:TLDc domain-containing protein n=1 Tax=Poecilia mexicana TaxID=48701 RepID=A0A3B3WJ68_9TELE
MTFQKQNERIQEQTQVRRKKRKEKEVTFIFSNLLHPSASPSQIITAVGSKRSLSLCSSVRPELESDEALEVLSCQELTGSPQLASHMPPKTQGYPWQLVHSTAIHGKSLQTLYRNTANLLLVKDMFKKVFGAFCSDPFRVSKYFYDAGETFLFSFGPDFQVGGYWFCEFCILVG